MLSFFRVLDLELKSLFAEMHLLGYFFVDTGRPKEENACQRYVSGKRDIIIVYLQDLGLELDNDVCSWNWSP